MLLNVRFLGNCRREPDLIRLDGERNFHFRFILASVLSSAWGLDFQGEAELPF
jgi:hypothetical protein